MLVMTAKVMLNLSVGGLPSARSVVHRLFLSGFKICLCLDTFWCLKCYTIPKKTAQLLTALLQRHFSCNSSV